MAQTFTPSDQATLARSTRKLLEDRYFTNLEILTHYEVHQPFEALEPQLEGMLRDAFRSKDVLIFNEFRSFQNPNTTLAEYVKDCRIFSGGRPVTNHFDWAEARYRLGKTPAGEPYVNFYIRKTLAGTDTQDKPFRFSNLVEYRVQFVHHSALRVFLDFRIAGMVRVDHIPDDAVPLPGKEELSAQRNVELPAVIDRLSDVIRRFANGRAIRLERFTYRNCGINDALSDRLAATLRAALPKNGLTLSDTAALRLRGDYAEEVNNLRIRFDLTDMGQGINVASGLNDELPLSWLASEKLTLRPEDFGKVESVRDTLKRLVAPQATPLQLELLTDHGRSGVEYWEGQSMKIQLRANRPCHVRLVYRLADGTQTILEEDFLVSPGKAGQLVTVAPGDQFVCAAPFGTEYLLAYASEEGFCPLPTRPDRRGYVREEGGYRIFVGSLQAMNEILTCRENKSAGLTEDWIQITTRSKKK
jgi:hypothetical protein